MNLDNVIQEILDDSKVVMLITRPHLRASLGYYIVARMTAMEDTEGLYLALNIPHKTVERKIKNFGGNPDKIFFIDCITSSIKSVETTQRVIYLDSPNLVLLEGTIKHALQILGGMRNFVYIESISTLLAYNSYQSFIKFLRMLTNEIRLYGLVGIIFMLDKELQDVEFSQATTFVDDILDLTNISIDDLAVG